MPVRVGIDLVWEDDIAAALDAQPARYLARVFSAREVAEAGGPDGPRAARLARSVAVKEAARKALRPGGADAVGLADVELTEGQIVLGGAAARLAAREGLDNWSVSVTRQSGYACAVVVASEGT